MSNTTAGGHGTANKSEKYEELLAKKVGENIFGDSFSWALDSIKDGLFVKRKVIKNDTVIINYKNRLCQVCLSTGIRYPYVPTNADIFADDWIIVALKKQ